MHKFYKYAVVIYPEERGLKRCGNPLSRWLTLPPEAGFGVVRRFEREI